MAILRKFVRGAQERLESWPLLTWVLLGFFIDFILFYLAPIFYDASRAMQFPKTIPIMVPIGTDFRSFLDSSSSWFHSGTVPPMLYPPFALLFFYPYTLVSPETAYKIETLLTVLCFVLTALVLPLLLDKQRKGTALVILLCVTGLSSYGLQFELERGQANVIAVAFSLAAIYIFHRHSKFRWLAYLLFLVSVQLKLYPAIFVFGLVDDWSDWKRNLKRFAGLGFASLAALFILGVDPVRRLISALTTTEAAHSTEAINLSASSFVRHILSFPWPKKRVFLWVQANPWLLQWILIACVLAACVLIVWQTHKHGLKGLNAHVLLAGAIAALIIPSVSFDYKLAFLPGIVAIWFLQAFPVAAGKKPLASGLLAFLFSLGYWSLLYPTINKPAWLSYNLPVLLLLMLVATAVAFLQPAHVVESVPGQLGGDGDGVEMGDRTPAV